jgi:hypothetical protein
MKLVVFVLGLAIGVGGGLWWGANHPRQAASIVNQEQRESLEAQIKVNEQANTAAKQYIAAHPGEADTKMVALRDTTQRQLDDLHARLDALKSP